MSDLAPETTGDAPGRGRLEGRRIVVVGAGTRQSDDPQAPVGNGRAISVLAAREGAHVTCVDRDPEALRGTTDLIDGATGVVADVTSDDGWLPDLDGLVLNVGAAWGFGLEGTSDADWDRTFALNLKSHFRICREALQRMDGGSIVFVSSVAGLKPGSRIPAYDASKAGMLGLMRHVALEGSRSGVRANVVAPGLIDTPLGRLATAGRPSRAKTPVPLRRQGTGWEVAYAVVWLLSGESSYVTGQTLAVDGGLSALT